MTTEVIYARIPANLKGALIDYAARNAMTQTTAIADLLERGLKAVTTSASIEEIERSAHDLRAKLATSEVQLREAQLRANAVEERERNLLSAYQGLAKRTEQTIGTCPVCTKAVRGYDLLVTGRCPQCNSGLASLLARPQEKSGLNQSEFLTLVGAVGLVLALAYLQTKSSG